MRILIGTPAYGYQVTAEYHASVLRAALHLARTRPEITIESKTIGLSILAVSRNILANLVLQGDYTHLLFIDADMGFDAGLIEKMIDFGEPVVGCLPPSRKRNLSRIVDAAARGAPRDQALDAGLDYIGQPALEGGRPQVRGDFLKAEVAGTGIMLIRREALEEMRRRCPDLWSDDPGGMYQGIGLKGVLQAFDPYRMANGLYTGEDVAFVRRWIERCGGEVWACWNARIVHVGREQVVGNYADRLAQLPDEA